MLPDWLRYDLEDKWERLRERLRLLGVRNWINEHPRAVTAIAAASAVLLVVVIVVQLIPDKPPPMEVLSKEWYYDQNSGKLFVAEKGLTPPVDAPSGPRPNGKPAGVRACVLSYSQEPNESERFIGFLETTAPPELLAQQPIQPGPDSAATQWGQGKLIRRIEDKTWFFADSREGQRIIEEAFAANADGERPIYCQPE